MLASWLVLLLAPFFKDARGDHFSPCANAGDTPFNAGKFKPFCTAGKNSEPAGKASFTSRVGVQTRTVADYGHIGEVLLEIGEWTVSRRAQSATVQQFRLANPTVSLGQRRPVQTTALHVQTSVQNIGLFRLYTKTERL